jgi:predicted O-methyltransferase YrrM
MPDTFDEIEFTPSAEPGWTAHNGMSPEVEVCHFFASLVRMLRPSLVLETGVGQGFMTRAILPVLGDARLRCYESDDGWRDTIRQQTLWDRRAILSHAPSPPTLMFKKADLCFLDSDAPVRLFEIESWEANAKQGAVALIHDASPDHDESTHHRMISDLIVGLGIAGVFLRNPRGSFLAIKQ